MADAQVFTAQRHHRTGAEAETFCTGIAADDIDAGFRTAVHLQTNLVTQTVGDQRLLGFNGIEFPRGSQRISRKRAGWRRYPPS